jgi:type IV fimbrial biogenesis protein FimT
MDSCQPLSKSCYLSPSPAQGFTLIELMITLAVMAILLGIAAPSFNNVVLSNKLSSYANNLVASANLARSEAIKRNSAITLCASSNGTSCAASGGWEQGWVIKTTSGTQIIQTQPAAASGFKITEGSALLSMDFDPSGVGTSSAASLKICRATPTSGDQERVVSISATGRASVAKTTTGSCS